MWSQQGPKLVGAGAVLYTELGSSASLSGDGNTAIVGGFNDNGETGAAWVFTRSGGVWSQQGPKLVGTDAVGGAGQGVSVSLSSDGNTGIVGGTYDNDFAGAAWVYTRSAGVWSWPARCGLARQTPDHYTQPNVHRRPTRSRRPQIFRTRTTAEAKCGMRGSRLDQAPLSRNAVTAAATSSMCTAPFQNQRAHSLYLV